MIYAKNNKIVPLPTRVGNILNFQKQSIEVKNKHDYFEVQQPELAENEMLLPLIDSDKIDNVIHQRKAINENMATELYTKIIAEGEVIFDEYRTLLSQAAVLDFVAGAVRPELKALTEELKLVKAGVLQQLAGYKDANDITNLKNWIWQTDQAEDLRTRINSFK